MPLIEEEQRFTARTLLLVGIPSLIGALILSIAVHRYAHVAIERSVCQAPALSPAGPAPFEFDAARDDCPYSSVAGISASLILGLAAFGFLIHSPNNMFFASLAFINPASRLPGAIATLAAKFSGTPGPIPADESRALQLLHFKDPAGFLAILTFYIIVLVFFSIIVVHDAKKVPLKGVAAIVIVIFLLPVERLIYPLLAPLLP